MAMARSDDFKTPACRVSYAQQLFKPRAAKNSTTKKYGCTLIFPLSAKAVLEKVVAEVVTAQWGEKGIARAKAGGIRLPFLAGDGKEARSKETGELHPGMSADVFFIRTQANEDRPPVVRFRSATIPATEEEVYSGCYGFAVLNAFAWNNSESGDGVSFGIGYFQKTGDGERLGGGGGVDVDKYFEKIADEGAAPAETKSGQGAGGLFG
ncbi:ssDNA-binding protein [Methylobacterium sp. Leaf87]|uniref:ssDNA-binding protein n=1 Tax=Methylobacterium sp. Leaf87 TaxID=1736243 RepID=UPI0009E77E41|nr:ssDNA-binding protein [Methylobacterium sp. Leaf87]